MPDTAGFYLWLLLMLFISVLLGSLTLVIWRSERRGNYRPRSAASPSTKIPEEEAAGDANRQIAKGE